MIRNNYRLAILEFSKYRFNTTLPAILGIVLIVIFFAITTVVVFNLQLRIIPDEGAHILVSQHFATSWGIPPDTPDTYSLGVLTHKPFLFYWINGRLLNLLTWIFPDAGDYKVLVTLRFAGVFYSTLGVIFCFLVAKEVIKNPWWQLMSLFLLTNTLMFVLHSGGVNYDSLTNLCAFAGIYFLVKLLKNESFYLNSIWWMIWILTGTLVKITILPLLLIMVIIWILYIGKNYLKIDFKSVFDRRLIPSLVILTTLVVTNSLLYAVNIVKYRAVIPPCTMILAESDCQKNPVYRRDKRVEENLPITALFDGNSTDPITWFDGFWVPTMVRKTYGFAGHKQYNPSDLSVTLYRWWFFLVLLLAVKYRGKPPLPILGLEAIVVFYLLTLLQTNLASELRSGFNHLGIQGRYFFPALGGLYVLFSYYAEKIPNRIFAVATAAATFTLFFVNSPLWILTYPATVKYPSTAINPEESSVPLVSASEVIQGFQSECSGAITQIEVLFSTEQILSPQSVKMNLTDIGNHQIVAEQKIASVPGENQVWLVFPLNSLPTTMEQQLRISLSTDGGQEEQILKLWSTTTDVYPFGDATINGIPTNKDLIFRYMCKKPILKDWFNE